MTTTPTGGAGNVRHLSIRVPWHDDGWRGTVCQRPRENASCLALKRIRENKHDKKQEATAGLAWDELDQEQWPACVPERAGFMAPLEFTLDVEHPYKHYSHAHVHLATTSFRLPPYSAARRPF